MIRRFFNSQTKTITLAAVILAVSALASRVLGLVRDRLLAGRFGAGEDLDIYFAAFRIPDFVYGILITGGIAAVFLPIFSEYFEKKEESAWEFANNVLNCFLVMLFALCGLLAIFTPWIINLVAPGFSPENKEITISLTRIMFLSPILFGLSSVFSGILHYFNRFVAYSFAPIFYNLGIIFGIIFFVPKFGLYGLAYGVILGAALHWILQIPAARKSGFRYQLRFNWKSEGLIKVFKLMIPRTVGSAVYNINLIVITAIASTLTAGSIAVFNFSNNLQYFPIGLIGASFAIASFPAMSRNWAAGLKDKFLENFSSTFRQIVFLVIPISVLMFILRAQLVRIILGTGEFGWIETRLTAASLGIFCLSIIASSLIPFLARAFYSFQNTKTPVVIGVFSMILNVILCFVFVSFLSSAGVFHNLVSGVLKLEGINNIAVVGLPLALSLSAVFQVVLLIIFLKRELKDIKLREISASFLKVILASVICGIAAYHSLSFSAGFLDVRTFYGILAQTATASLVGIVIYFMTALILKSPEAQMINLSIFKRIFRL